MAESCFLSALQPNTSCTAYMVPSDGVSPDPGAKARRVQEQVRMRLAEKKSSSLPRLDDSLLGPSGESHPSSLTFQQPPAPRLITRLLPAAFITRAGKGLQRRLPLLDRLLFSHGQAAELYSLLIICCAGSGWKDLLIWSSASIFHV